MTNELKPVAYEVEIQLLTRKGKAVLYEKPLSKETKFTPLYAIPEGYHIVAIDHEQEQRKRNYEASMDAEMSAYLNDAEGLKNLMEQRMRDNLERHNETVRAKSNDFDAEFINRMWKKGEDLS